VPGETSPPQQTDQRSGDPNRPRITTTRSGRRPGVTGRGGKSGRVSGRGAFFSHHTECRVAEGKASARSGKQISPDKQMRASFENRLGFRITLAAISSQTQGNGNPAQDLTWATTTPLTHIFMPDALTFFPATSLGICQCFDLFCCRRRHPGFIGTSFSPGTSSPVKPPKVPNRFFSLRSTGRPARTQRKTIRPNCRNAEKAQVRSGAFENTTGTMTSITDARIGSTHSSKNARRRPQSSKHG